MYQTDDVAVLENVHPSGLRVVFERKPPNLKARVLPIWRELPCWNSEKYVCSRDFAYAGDDPVIACYLMLSAMNWRTRRELEKRERRLVEVGTQEHRCVVM